MIRISTPMIQSAGAAAVLQDESNLYQIQQQLSTGRSVNTAGDNPLAAAQATEVAAQAAINTQYTANQQQATAHVSLAESTLGSVQNVLQQVRQSLVQAGGGALTDTDRTTIAQSLQQDYNQLLSLANSRDTDGTYLFGGFNQNTQPFTATTTGAQYNGDQGVRTLQVAGGATMPISANGAQIFQMVRTGNGTFSAAQNPANTGTGTIDQGSVTNFSQLTGDQYAINFAVAGGNTTYTVVDTTKNVTVVNATAYSAGSAIQFAGQEVSVSGAPANGDSFTVAPSANQDIFTTIQNAIAALNVPQASSASQAAFTTQMGASIADVDQGLNNSIVARSQMGANLQELASLGTSTSSLNVSYQTQLTNLTQVDYASAVTQFMSAQTAYQAVQTTYAKFSQENLFSLL
jgi:flagellar hook-associated protein 3 FlgL